MGRLAGVRGRDAVRVAEANEWHYLRNNGDHMVFSKPGSRQNLSIPDHRELDPGTLRGIIRTMGMTVDEFLAALKS